MHISKWNCLVLRSVYLKSLCVNYRRKIANTNWFSVQKAYPKNKINACRSIMKEAGGLTYKWEEDQQGCSKFQSLPACHLSHINCMYILSQCCWASACSPKSSKNARTPFQTYPSANDSRCWGPYIDQHRCSMIRTDL